MESTDEVYDLARKHFVHYFEQLMTGLKDMFPSNKKILLKHAKFELVIVHMKDPQLKTQAEERLISQFHTQISPFYKDIHNRQSDFLVGSEVSILEDFGPVWNEMDTDNQNIMWEYFDVLIQHATCYNMYSKIPEGLRNTISQVTTNLESKTKEGGKVDLASMSGQILNGADPAEMKQFALGMMDNKEELENIFRIATSQLQKMKDTQS